MIVLDDQLSALRIRRAIEEWYAGSVIVLGWLRPYGVIKDDGVAALLRSLKQPTFVTINDKDFWKRIKPHAGYSIICFDLPRERADEVPSMLRELLKRPELNSKRNRMGKVVMVSGGRYRFYE